MDMYKPYNNYGTFEVTTEGDYEGNTVRELGVYTGYIDEIAFALADKCTYSLNFKILDHREIDMTPRKDTVKISLDPDSGIYDFTINSAERYFRSLLDGRDVRVLDVSENRLCTITNDKKTISQRREEILKKLTDEERKILGL